jgi:lipoprotein-anchoring transpeptidase ErfK/SrfK
MRFVPLVPILSATWLFWLYSNTPLASIAQFSASERSSVIATLPPLRAVLPTLQQANQSMRSLTVSDAPDPDAVRLEVHLKQRRVMLYYGNTRVRDYPIAIGQSGWETPTGQFRVLNMQERPDWIHPLTNQLVRNEDLKNPLGRFWIGFWTDGKNWVGFHGTPKPNSVGQALSHGCLRMHDADIDELYYQVSTGTPVTVKP